MKELNWQEIQEYYNTGKTWRDIVTQFKIDFSTISSAAKKGLFKSRSISDAAAISKYKKIGRKLSKETKLKISIGRKAYLAANPDKPAWKTHNKFKSIPCEKLKAQLRAYEIAFEGELEPLRHKGRFFSADIAFEQYGVIWEVNGSQHYDTDGNLKPYYQNRHDLIELEGWRVFEIPYHVAMRKGIIEELLEKTVNLSYKPNQDYQIYKKKEENSCLDCGVVIWPESERCRKCASALSNLSKRKVSWPEKEILQNLILNNPILRISKVFNVTGNTILKWLKFYKIKPFKPEPGYWNKDMVVRDSGASVKGAL